MTRLPAKGGAAFALAAALALVPPSPAHPAPAAPRGGGAGNIPPLELVTLAGESRSYCHSPALGSPALFFFFETRAPASVMEMTFLGRLYPGMRKKGLDVVAVEASGLDRGETEKAMEAYGRIFPAPDFPVVPDPEYRLSRLFDVAAVPTVFIVGPDGTVLRRIEGFSREEQAELARQIVASLSGEGDDGGLAEAAGADEPPLEAGPSPGGEGAVVEVGAAIPPIEATDLGGRPIPPGWDSEGAKVNVVFFWGAMCLPCMREMTFLEELYGRAGPEGLRVLAVEASGLPPERTAALMERYTRLYPEPTYPIVVDTNGRIRRLFGVREGGPATFFVDRAGKVTFATDEFPQGYEETLESKITVALGLGAEDDGSSRGTAAASGTPPDLRGGVHAGGALAVDEDLSLGDHYYGLWRYGEALPCYLRALAAAPGNIHALSRVADIYERQGHLRAALEEWEKVLRADPGNDGARERVAALRGRVE